MSASTHRIANNQNLSLMLFENKQYFMGSRTNAVNLKYRGISGIVKQKLDHQNAVIYLFFLLL